MISKDQINKLKQILEKNKNILEILNVLEEYSKENKDFTNYYLSAGCINQTVFNYLSGYKIESFIKDYDIAYFDPDTTYEKEDKIIKDLERKLKNINVSYDIKNQARVHIWYNEKYNANRKPYKSVEDAISKWSSTVTCIGVRKENNDLKVYAPYGLDDIFNMTIRPVKKEVTKEIYEMKAKDWKKRWNKLKIEEW